MEPAKNAHTHTVTRYCTVTGIIILAIELLVGCTQSPSIPNATSIVAPSSMPRPKPTSTTALSSGDVVEANIQAVEHGYIGTMTDRMKYYKVPGVSIAVINHGVIEWARGYGIEETDTTQSITDDSLFQAGSISKPLAAMAALYYVQTGMLSLDEDVNNKLVSWKVPDNEYTQNSKVTLRRLLSHGAGLTVQGFMGYAENEKLPTLLQVLDGEPPANSEPIRVFMVPGTKWEYSGGGYVVVQQLLEDVTGKPFSEMMQDTILEKLEMVHSTYEQPLPQSLFSVATTGHNTGGNAIDGNWHTYPEMSAAGLWTTPSDLAYFIIEIQQSAGGNSNRILSTEMTQQMLTRQIGEWGLGLQVGGNGNTAWFAHGGQNAGFSCGMFGFIENGQGAVVMTNSDNGYRLAKEIIDTIAGVYKWPYVP